MSTEDSTKYIVSKLKAKKPKSCLKNHPYSRRNATDVKSFLNNGPPPEMINSHANTGVNEPSGIQSLEQAVDYDPSNLASYEEARMKETESNVCSKSNFHADAIRGEDPAAVPLTPAATSTNEPMVNNSTCTQNSSMEGMQVGGEPSNKIGDNLNVKTDGVNNKNNNIQQNQKSLLWRFRHLSPYIHVMIAVLAVVLLFGVAHKLGWVQLPACLTNMKSWSMSRCKKGQLSE